MSVLQSFGSMLTEGCVYKRVH